MAASASRLERASFVGITVVVTTRKGPTLTVSVKIAAMFHTDAQVENSDATLIASEDSRKALQLMP